MQFHAASVKRNPKDHRLALRVTMGLLALILAFLPLLNGSFGASHDPVRNPGAQQQAGHESDHAHEQPDGHALGDGHTHAHNAGDHSHETAFLPPAALRAGTVLADRPMSLEAAVRPPARGTRLDRPPKGTVTA